MLLFSKVSGVTNSIMKSYIKYGFCIKTLHQKLQFTSEVNITGSEMINTKTDTYYKDPFVPHLS